MTGPGRIHLHRRDVPATLAILASLLAHRSSRPAGYEPTEHGAWVDWKARAGSWLPSTEVAAVRIAPGCATAEHRGGLPPEVIGEVWEALHAITGGPAGNTPGGDGV